jgi:uncharacterized protein YdhG (YjbR/CyaY superfamily)
MKPSSPAVDAYIAAFPLDVQVLLRQMRATIRAAAPEAEERMAYGLASYKRAKYLVHFGGFKRHIGFFPTPSAVTHFAKEFARYKTSKGTVQFPLDQPLPLELVAEVVRYRLAEEAGA